MAGHIVTLICEGSCNPTIGVVDRLVRDAIIEAKGQPPVGNARLWELQRELKYTEHAQTNAVYFYTCMECGTRRRFGRAKRRKDRK